MGKIETSIFVETTDLVKIDNDSFVPTALYYGEDNNTLFGHPATTKNIENKLVNTNFKVALGKYNAKKSDNKKFETEAGGDKSAFQLTSDFFNKVLDNIEGQISVPSYEKKGLKIIVAEPLFIQLDDKDSNWLKNYRDNIRRIIHRYESVDFLPEPFAVYQYYRYGLKIPQLQDALKHIAFIIDFGGGTFDVSIIESKKTGDISLSGKHAKPLGASSIPIGGFYINEKITEYLILKVFDNENPQKKKVGQYIKTYHRIKSGELKFNEIKDEKQAFIYNFDKLSISVETKKIELCKKIKNWDLGAECYDKVLLELPKNPFIKNTTWFSSTLYGHELRTIYLGEIWNKNLKPTIKFALDRAKDSLETQTISATLISGGSSNIRWLEKLLVRDFAEKLGRARPIPLSASFQEVVSKGLAIECARRHYDPESEFVSVTYNPVRLILDPDGKGLELQKYSSVDSKLDMTGTRNGDLIPSAQSIKHFIGDSLQWKVRLKHPPRHFLKYYFMRPSTKPIVEQPGDIKNLYNINTVTNTTKGSKFDSKIRVQLSIKEDGTVYPKFIYRAGNRAAGVDEYVEDGDPFVLDVTGDNNVVDVNRYIGFDFGTSNSSLSFLTNEHISAIEYRSKSKSWLELKELVSKLPYPISFPLRKYMSIIDIDKSVEAARDAFEACLGFMSYLAFSELLAIDKTKINLFNNFPHRSMGPLKDLLDKCLRQLNKKAHFSEPLIMLIEKHDTELTKAIKDFNSHKHKMLKGSEIDCHSHLKVITNICNKAMKDKVFGFFEDMKPVKFKRNIYCGIFKSAKDVSPFYDTFCYEGSESFDISTPFIIDLKTNKGLSLFPFLFWEETSTASMIRCYIFDKNRENDLFYKPIDDDAALNLKNNHGDLESYSKDFFKGNIEPDGIIEVKLSPN